MALYVEEAVAIFAEANDPFTKAPITDLTATCEVWHVETDGDPKSDPSVRGAPGWDAFAMPYSEAALGYVGYFQPDARRTTPTPKTGKYAYRVHLVGDAWDNVEYGTFKLAP